jgi:hypothetical protein
MEESSIGHPDAEAKLARGVIGINTPPKLHANVTLGPSYSTKKVGKTEKVAISHVHA